MTPIFNTVFDNYISIQWILEKVDEMAAKKIWSLFIHSVNFLKLNFLCLNAEMV